MSRWRVASVLTAIGVIFSTAFCLCATPEALRPDQRVVSGAAADSRCCSRTEAGPGHNPPVGLPAESRPCSHCDGVGTLDLPRPHDSTQLSHHLGGGIPPAAAVPVIAPAEGHSLRRLRAASDPFLPPATLFDLHCALIA